MPPPTVARAGVSRALLATSLLLGSFVVLSCDDRGAPGDSCKTSDAQCLDAKTELHCQNGELVAAPCEGPKGCRETASELLCDFSENSVGAPCALADEGNAMCRPNRTERIRCAGGRYLVEPCRGDAGCRGAGGKVLCDQSRGKVEEACSGTTHACSLDGKALLVCSEGAFEQHTECGGEKGCSVGAGAVQCDQRKRQVDEHPP